MQVKIQLFGAFRPLGDVMELQLVEQAKVSDVRAAFAANVPGELHDTLAVSRFADEKAVLAEDAAIAPNAILAILPPVSGG